MHSSLGLDLVGSMMTKEQALAILQQVIGELPFKTVQAYNLVQVFTVLQAAVSPPLKAVPDNTAETLAK